MKTVDRQAEKAQAAEEGAASARRKLQTPAYACSCRNDSLGCCIKRCTEPLAWGLEKKNILEQKQCPLFTIIPKELRDLIYEFALTEPKFNHLGQTGSKPVSTRGTSLNIDRAEHLLLTCKAVYLETYLLPLRLNPYRPRCFNGLSAYMPRVTLPWQFANIQSFDIHLTQATLEGTYLHDFIFDITGWQLKARHKGVFVAPYTGLKDTDGGSCRSCHFTLLPTQRSDDIIPLRDVLQEMCLPPGFQMPMSNMRLQRARPIVHLTLRLLREDWWTWNDDPLSTDVTKHHLGLEPTLGHGRSDVSTRPNGTRMQELAQQRRNGGHPSPPCPSSRETPGWAHVIAELPDIKTLELVLETFEEKKAQLETVVECAKTWRFPIAGTHCELSWDGAMESMHWSEAVEKDGEIPSNEWWARKTDFEIRIIRFKRRQIAS